MRHKRRQQGKGNRNKEKSAIYRKNLLNYDHFVADFTNRQEDKRHWLWKQQNNHYITLLFQKD